MKPPPTSATAKACAATRSRKASRRSPRSVRRSFRSLRRALSRVIPGMNAIAFTRRCALLRASKDERGPWPILRGSLRSHLRMTVVLVQPNFIRLPRQHRIGRRAAVGDLQAEQAADQFDRDARGAAAFVEERVELDDIDRAHQF